VTTSKDGYISAVCNDNRGEGIIIGEWSLSVASEVENNDEFAIRDRPDQIDWYRSYWAAQVQTFESPAGGYSGRGSVTGSEGLMSGGGVIRLLLRRVRFLRMLGVLVVSVLARRSGGGGAVGQIED
jgi:hypothetical protein